MRATAYYKNGSPDVIECVELPKPVPAQNEVLLKVRAAALNPLDLHLMHGLPRLLQLVFRTQVPTKEKPGRIGRDVAGIVEEVGNSVTDFKPGDEVFGCAPGSCSEFVTAAQDRLVFKPSNVTWEEGASCGVATLTALQGLRDGAHIKPGAKVLVNGAAGGVGTFAVQIAKAYGAEVTAVCSAPNLDFVRSIGADHAIDYAAEDFTRSGKRYDIIFDLVGNHSLKACSRAMTRDGIFLAAGILNGNMAAMIGRLIAAPIRSRFSRQSFIILMAKSSKDDLQKMADLMKDGKVKPVIGGRYSLGEVPEAMRVLDTKRARGKLVIDVQ